MNSPLIGIIGRPNVGKSTLFNRILGTRRAIVDDVPGVTRDRHYAEGLYQGRPFRLVDTGGLDPTSKEGMLSLIRTQANMAIAESDVLIMVMDGRAGLTPADEEIVTALRGIIKPVFFAVNKIDTPKSSPLVADFCRLGTETLFPVSAEHGIGVDELLEAAIFPYSDPRSEDEPPATYPRIAIVGRPNVGKSTLINTLFGAERMVVSDLPGTTRDSVDTLVSYEGKSYIFTDTAGIRRRGRIDRGVEGYSVLRAHRALGRSDLAILLLDGEEGITEQDTKIAGLILKQGRGCLVLVNKWDIRAHEAGAYQQFTLDLERRLSFLSWVPIEFGSALNAKLPGRLFPMIDHAMTTFTSRVPTSHLNQFLQNLLQENPLPVRKGKPTKPTKSVFATQVATHPPVFAFFVGHPRDVGKSYIRFMENRLRTEYDFYGSPIQVLFKQK